MHNSKKNQKETKTKKNHKNLKCVPALIGDHWYQETKCGFKLGTVLKMHRNCGSFICFGGFCVLGKPHCIFISEISWAGWSSWNSIGKFQYVQIYLYNYTSFHTNYMSSFFFRKQTEDSNKSYHISFCQHGIFNQLFTFSISFFFPFKIFTQI